MLSNPVPTCNVHHKIVCGCFVGDGYPLTGELHVWLREIVGLLPTKRGAPNTFVKRYVCTFLSERFIFCHYVIVKCFFNSVVLPDESGVSGQQTRVVRGSVNPQFNHTMVYDGFQPSDLFQACAEITVWSSQPSTCLGGVRLSTGSGDTHVDVSKICCGTM